MLQSTGCLALLSYGIAKRDQHPYLWIYGLIYFLGHPIINEIVLNIKAYLCRNSTQRQKKNLSKCFQIVYSKGYNITACGLEKCHPFDSCKYERIFKFLKQKKIIDKSTNIHEPDLPSREFLLEIMNFYNLFTLNYSLSVCKRLEVPLFFLPAWFLRMRVLNPMMRATQGSVDAACIAFHNKWAINLSGGYHHADANSGGGFCVYPDITFIVHYLKKWYNIQKFMIVDLDAHQGNGHERDHLNDENIHIVDAYNPFIYPGDFQAQRAIKTQIHVTNQDDDRSYLNKLQQFIPEAIEDFQPDFIIYNAGTDCLKDDPLGLLQISSEGIKKRDELMFQFALEKYQIPIVMLMSGGYQSCNAEIIADSIENLFNKFNLRTSNDGI